MAKKIYPHWLRAIRIREDMAWTTIKNTPTGEWGALEDMGLLLGSPHRGQIRAALPMTTAKELDEVVPDVRVVDIYGTDMRRMCVPILRALEEAGEEVLGISLSTQRMSAVTRGNNPVIDILYSRFPMEL